MTERQAWKKLANNNPNFLCCEIGDMKDDDIISAKSAKKMKSKIKECLAGYDHFGWQLSSAGVIIGVNTRQQLRSDFCWLMYFEMGGE